MRKERRCDPFGLVWRCKARQGIIILSISAIRSLMDRADRTAVQVYRGGESARANGTFSFTHTRRLVSVEEGDTTTKPARPSLSLSSLTRRHSLFFPLSLGATGVKALPTYTLYWSVPLSLSFSLTHTHTHEKRYRQMHVRTHEWVERERNPLKRRFVHHLLLLRGETLWNDES